MAQVLLVFHIKDNYDPRPVWVGPECQMDDVVKNYAKHRAIPGGELAVHKIDEDGYVSQGSEMIPITEELLREARN